jgi:hypothetical protein
MPITFRRNALRDIGNIMREMSYGYRGDIGTSTSDEDSYRVGQWQTSDQQYILGQRDTPGNFTLGRVRVASAIRSILTNQRLTYFVGFWWDVDPRTAGYATDGAVIVHLDNIQNGAGTTARDLYIGYVPNSAAYPSTRAHWLATFSGIGLGADAPAGAGDYTLPDDLEFTPAETTNGTTGEFLGIVRPTSAILESLPARARAYAGLTVTRPRLNNEDSVLWAVENGVWTARYRQQTAAMQAIAALNVTGQGLADSARESYRVWLRMEQHRRQSASRFATFRSAKPQLDVEVIPTLPFLPHGLASSRRWGIEIESGGARGIEAPAGGWVRKTDGSLRSAWSGYVEVQNFEPYDREEQIDISWYDCQDYPRHMPHQQYYDEARREYAYRVNPEYLAVADCQNCGQRTRTVRVEPQTITHSAQRDDCAEFVSPILVSMHSNGLHELLEQIKVQPQNDSAGVHVHVEARDLNDAQLATLIYGYDMLEPMIEKSYRRNRRDYCARREPDEVLRAARAVKNKTGESLRGGNRYVTVNTNSLSRHGTVEFRAMGPVYDYDHLIRWAMFCREMVNSVAAGATQKDFGRVKKWEDVLSIFTRYGKEFVRAALYEMTGEVSEAARLSKDTRALTTEAVNADLASAMANLSDVLTAAARESRTSAANIRGFGQAVGSLGVDHAAIVANMQARLVESDNLLVTV